MLNLNNQTPFSAQLFSGRSQTGLEQTTCVVKARFNFNEAGELTLSQKSVPIYKSHQYHENDAKNHSISHPDESMPFKSGGELMVMGSAQCVEGYETDVNVSLLKSGYELWSKSLKVFGARRWYARRSVVKITKPRPLKKVPLRYEYAYGGRDPKKHDRVFPFNAIGMGYTESTWRVDGIRLPLIELRDQLIKSPRSRPMPAGFGPLSFAERPRLVSRINYQKVSPFFYHVAPDDQRIDQPFEGGEKIHLTGLMPDYPLKKAFTLTVPKVSTSVLLPQNVSRKLTIDTVAVNVDNMQLDVVGRVGLPLSGIKSETVKLVLN